MARRWMWVGATTGLAGLAAAGGVGASASYVRSFSRGHLYPPNDVPSAPVGLVLGARVYPDGTPSTFLRARLDLAGTLLAREKIEQILVSGDHAAPEYDEPAAMQNYLRASGIPDSKIITDPHGYDTYDSCIRARDVYRLHRITVITQQYHLPRAVGTARALGLDAAGVGDRSAKTLRRSWIHGLARDQLACVKTIVDLGTNRQPVPKAPAS